MILKTNAPKYALGSHLEILEDQAVQWTFDEITSPELDQKFSRPQEEKTIYLRLRTEGSVQFPITLWDPISFSEMVNKAQYGFGIYYGIFLIMAFYNLFLFFSVKDSTYLHYVAFIVSIGFSQMTLNGLAFQFIWPEWPWWANRSVPFFIVSSVFIGLNVTKQFLGLKENAPRINQIILALMACVMVVIPLSLFASYALSTRIGAILAILAAFFVVIVGIFNIHQGYPRYFFIAWTGFLIGVTATALKNFGLLPAHFLQNSGCRSAPQSGSSFCLLPWQTG